MSCRDKMIGGLVPSKSEVRLVPKSTGFTRVAVCASQCSVVPATPLVWKSPVPAEAIRSPAAFNSAMPFNSVFSCRISSVSEASSRSLETTPPKRRWDRSTMPRVVEMSLARSTSAARDSSRNRTCSVACQATTSAQTPSSRP